MDKHDDPPAPTHFAGPQRPHPGASTAERDGRSLRDERDVGPVCQPSNRRVEQVRGLAQLCNQTDAPRLTGDEVADDEPVAA